MRIAICTPSRGLVHSRTVANTLRQRDVSATLEWFFTHDLPIPACFNNLVDQAKAWGADYIWFVEEDIVPQRHTLSQLLKADGDIRCAEYLIAWNGQPVTTYKDGKPIFTGLGCALIPMWVFDKVGEFRADIAYDIVDGEYIRNDNEVGYGGQDVHFYMRCQEEGINLNIVGEVDHLRVIEQGKPDTNHGAHVIKPIAKA